jgi:mercuric ion transport protein
MKFQSLDKLGAVGALLAAASCPACFPLLAVAGSALGLSFLRPYEGVLMYAFQGLVLMALVGNILAFRRHKQIVPLIVGVTSPVLIFFAFYVYFAPAIMYTGFFGLLVAAIMNFIAGRRCSSCKT